MFRGPKAVLAVPAETPTFRRSHCQRKQNFATFANTIAATVPWMGRGDFYVASVEILQKIKNSKILPAPRCWRAPQAPQLNSHRHSPVDCYRTTMSAQSFPSTGPKKAVHVKVRKRVGCMMNKWCQRHMTVMKTAGHGHRIKKAQRRDAAKFQHPLAGCEFIPTFMKINVGESTTYD